MEFFSWACPCGPGFPFQLLTLLVALASFRGFHCNPSRATVQQKNNTGSLEPAIKNLKMPLTRIAEIPHSLSGGYVRQQRSQRTAVLHHNYSQAKSGHHPATGCLRCRCSFLLTFLSKQKSKKESLL